jgi:hypothetical protein
MIDYITPIKEELDKSMHIVCGLFVTIGFPAESPRWFNFRSFDEDTKILTVGSTQRSALKFAIGVPFNHVSCDEFWPQFRAYRTAFLKENYPTIDVY